MDRLTRTNTTFSTNNKRTDPRKLHTKTQLTHFIKILLIIYHTIWTENRDVTCISRKNQFSNSRSRRTIKSATLMTVSWPCSQLQARTWAAQISSGIAEESRNRQAAMEIWWRHLLVWTNTHSNTTRYTKTHSLGKITDPQVYGTSFTLARDRFPIFFDTLEHGDHLLATK